MFYAPPEVQTAAGYLLALGLGVVLYMRFAFTRAPTNIAVRTSFVRVAVVAAWGATLTTYVLSPDLALRWNFFMVPQVRWFTTVPSAIAILLMIWAMNSQLALGPDGRVFASGPYAWCRYPFDAALSLYFVSVTLLCSNWMLLAVTLSAVLLHRIGVPYELERYRRKRLGAAYNEYAGRVGWFLPSAAPVKKTQYQVPSRFGLTAIIGLLTVLAIIFGSLKAVESPPVVYLFVVSEILAICLVQILFGSSPRGASTLTGAILLPLWVYLTLEMPRIPTSDIWLAFGIKTAFLFILAAFGALMGYCIGTLAAGFFLMMDLVEPWLIRDSTIYQLPAHNFPAQDGRTDGD